MHVKEVLQYLRTPNGIKRLISKRQPLLQRSYADIGIGPSPASLFNSCRGQLYPGNPKAQFTQKGDKLTVAAAGVQHLESLGSVGSRQRLDHSSEASPTFGSRRISLRRSFILLPVGLVEVLCRIMRHIHGPRSALRAARRCSPEPRVHTLKAVGAKPSPR